MRWEMGWESVTGWVWEMEWKLESESKWGWR